MSSMEEIMRKISAGTAKSSPFESDTDSVSKMSDASSTIGANNGANHGAISSSASSCSASGPSSCSSDTESLSDDDGRHDDRRDDDRHGDDRHGDYRHGKQRKRSKRRPKGKVSADGKSIAGFPLVTAKEAMTRTGLTVYMSDTCKTCKHFLSTPELERDEFGRMTCMSKDCKHSLGMLGLVYPSAKELVCIVNTNHHPVPDVKFVPTLVFRSFSPSSSSGSSSSPFLSDDDGDDDGEGNGDKDEIESSLAKIARRLRSATGTGAGAGASAPALVQIEYEGPRHYRVLARQLVAFLTGGQTKNTKPWPLYQQMTREQIEAENQSLTKKTCDKDGNNCTFVNKFVGNIHGDDDGFPVGTLCFSKVTFHDDPALSVVEEDGSIETFTRALDKFSDLQAFPNAVVVILSETCGACRGLWKPNLPHLEDFVMKTFDNFPLVIVNSKIVPDSFPIEAYPTFIVFSHGKSTTIDLNEIQITSIEMFCEHLKEMILMAGGILRSHEERKMLQPDTKIKFETKPDFMRHVCTKDGKHYTELLHTNNMLWMEIPAAALAHEVDYITREEAKLSSDAEKERSEGQGVIATD